MEYTFKLEKAAKKSGGDKYICGEWVVYFPQSVSRIDGVTKEVIVIVVG